ncbi:alpha/beta hydrolase-fold protein [Streptomyces sp. NPDC097619]|uniref:alpha/beta hydrolase n=1 Tax=Streptomyces sp. NPDC097619 TaxID=3157228 RepID=UPI0033211922
MPLTGDLTLALAALLACAVFTAVVVGWPRLSGPGPRFLLGRAGALLGLTLALAVPAGLALNSAYGFHSGWSDLLGLRREDPGADGPGLRVTGVHRWKYRGTTDEAVTGRIDAVRVRSRDGELTTPGYVHLPPEYLAAPPERRRSFPVVVALSGYPSTPRVLLDLFRYPQLARDGVRAGRMRPTVLVMLTPTVAPPRDTECVDVPGGPRTETFFAEDLPAAVAARYGLTRDPRAWGVMGNSVGGYCALKLALRRSDAYRAGAGLSAPYRAAHDADTGDLFGGDPALERENDLLWLLRNRPQPPVSLLVASSRRGEHQYPRTLEFVAAVRAPARVSSILLDSGGHNYETWGRETRPALEWLVGRLRTGRDPAGVSPGGTTPRP